jgi:hypothetical protein
MLLLVRTTKWIRITNESVVLPFKIAYEKSFFIPFNFVSNLVLAQSPKSEKLNT